MKNLYLKYILLSVAISSSLLFTACGKKSEPVNEVPENTQTEETTTSEEAEQDVSVYMDEDGIPEFNSKQGKVEGHTVDLTDKSLETSSPETTDITGKDHVGPVLEGEYDPMIHSTQAVEDQQETQAEVPTQHSPEYQQMLEDLVKEIYNSGESYIPADPTVEAALGGTHGTTESTGGIDWDAPSNPKFAGGSLE